MYLEQGAYGLILWAFIIFVVYAVVLLAFLLKGYDPRGAL